MQSLRRYLTTSELKDIAGIPTVDNLTLIQAEQDIDNIIAGFYTGIYSPYYIGTNVFDNVTLTTTTATINNTNVSNGYFAYTVLEILSGNLAGNKYPIKNNTNNVLTFWDTNTGLTGNVVVKIYQQGKAPFVGDCESVNSTIYKSINQRVKQAVAYQYQFRLDNVKNFDTVNPLTSYSINGASLSESFNTDQKITIEQRISPQALDVLGGLTVQTI